MGSNSIVVVVSAILRNKEGKILMLKRSIFNKANKNRWQLPEGKLEFGETLNQALAREVKEETNLTIINPKLVNIFTHPMKIRNIHYHIIRIIFEAEWHDRIVLSQDHATYQWSDPKKAIKLPLIAGTREIIREMNVI